MLPFVVRESNFRLNMNLQFSHRVSTDWSKRLVKHPYSIGRSLREVQTNRRDKPCMRRLMFRQSLI